MAFINKLLDKLLESPTSAENSKKLEYLIVLLQAIATSCSIYATEYSIESIEGTENNQTKLLYSLSFLLCSAVSLASVCFGKNNILTKTLSYSAALLPAVIGSYSYLKLLQGFAVNLSAYLVSYQTLNWIFPSQKTVNEEQRQEHELQPLKNISHKENRNKDTHEAHALLKVSTEPNPELQETNSLLSTSNSSSASTSRAGSDPDSGQFSNDSNESPQTELPPLTAKDCQLYLLKEIKPQLGSLQTDISKLQNLIQTMQAFNSDTRISLSKQNNELLNIPLAKQKLQTRDGYNVEAGLTYVYDFVKPLANFIQSISNTTIYNLNTSTVECVTREFNYRRSILVEIKNLVAKLKALENQNSSLPKRKKNKKTVGQTELINTIDQDLETLLKKIPEPKLQTSTPNKTTTYNYHSKSQAPVHFLTERELDALRKDFNALKNNLDTLENISKVKLNFQTSLQTISAYLFQKFYDLSCLKYPNYEAMLQDKNVEVSVGFFNTIIQQLTSIQNNASLQNIIPNDLTGEINLQVIQITEEINKTIEKMKKTIDSMQHRFEYKQSYTQGKQAGLEQAANIGTQNMPPKRVTLDNCFFTRGKVNNQVLSSTPLPVYKR